MANTPAPHRPAIAGLPGFRPYLPEADIEWLTGRFAEILRTGQLQVRVRDGCIDPDTPIRVDVYGGE